MHSLIIIMELQMRPSRDRYSGQTGLMIQFVTCPRTHDLVTDHTMGPILGTNVSGVREPKRHGGDIHMWYQGLKHLARRS